MEYILATPQGVRLRELDKIANIFAQHLVDDDQPKAMETPAAVAGSQPPQPVQPEVPMPPGLSPASGGQPPMPAGGNQMDGMQAEVPAQGRPPIAETGI